MSLQSVRPVFFRWGVATLAGTSCALLLSVLYSGFGRDPHEVPFLLKGKLAPSFSLQRLDNGEVVTMADLQGKPVVLNFWASWCAPCKREQPELDWAAQKYRQEVQFLGVVFEDTEQNARQFLLENGMGFPHLLDPLSRTAVDYGVAGVPETYFIDRQGMIVDKFVGPISTAVLKERVEELLEG